MSFGGRDEVVLTLKSPRKTRTSCWSEPPLPCCCCTRSCAIAAAAAAASESAATLGMAMPDERDRKRGERVRTSSTRKRVAGGSSENMILARGVRA